MNSRTEVFLVEDNPEDAKLVEGAIKEAGVDVNLTVAETGEQALTIIRQDGESSKPDLILTELRAGGHELLEVLKDDSELDDIPVVVLTNSQEWKDIQAVKGKADGYLTKPLTVSELEGSLRMIGNPHRETTQSFQLPSQRD